MIPLIVAVSLLVTVLIAGVAAGPLVRRAAPVLMRTPRLAVGVLGGVLIVWLIGFAAFGPMLAWALGTPTGLLPGATGEVCQRCLNAVNPLPPGMGFSAGIPAVLLLSLPLLVGGIMLAGGLRYRRQQQRQKQQLHQALQLGARAARLDGRSVTVIPHAEPTAFAVADRRWGIVVSTALLKLLSTEELAAVLAHEAAHVRQRHHLILEVLHGMFAPLRRIPLVAAIRTAIPQYLEMAADNAARQRSGTDVMASALLKIGEGGGPATDHAVGGAVALHVAGVDRIRHLIAPPNASGGIAPMIAMGVTSLLMSLSTVLVLLPYWQAILDGCII